MAEPELKSRSSRDSVAKAASQEKMEGRYSACSFCCRHHMVQGCMALSCALMQYCLMQKYSQMDAAEMQRGVLCVSVSVCVRCWQVTKVKGDTSIHPFSTVYPVRVRGGWGGK